MPKTVKAKCKEDEYLVTVEDDVKEKISLWLVRDKMKHLQVL
ncbi:MAG: hypothetical protein ACOC85_05405 [Thermoplasmatota archaeon]